MVMSCGETRDAQEIRAWGPRIVRAVEAAKVWEVALPDGAEDRQSDLSVEVKAEGQVVWVLDGGRKVPLLTSVLWAYAKGGRYGSRLLGSMSIGTDPAG